MSSKFREKIALGVFAALVLLSLCGLGWYLVAGHSWNVAASNIDDTVGSMEGYTAIVYEGTAKPKPEKDNSLPPSAGGSASGTNAGSSQSGAQSGGTSSQSGSSSGSSTVLNIADSSANGGSLGNTGSRTSSTDGGASASNSEAAQPDAGSASSTDADSDAAQSDDANTTDDDAAPQPDASQDAVPSVSTKPVVTADSVAENYLSKKASVLQLDLSDTARYAEGLIVRRGTHRFGIVSIDAKTPRADVLDKVQYLNDSKVDYVVVIAPATTLVSNISDIDIAIGTNSLEPSTMGSTVNGRFAVDAPRIGKVGTILISPSNVVSAKVADSI